MVSWPRVHLTDETMREGMQIEAADIPVETKIRLIDALSACGLRTIVVGSFVSPKYTPQMAQVDEIVKGFHPVPGVEYVALALNEQGRERVRRHVPPLSERRDPPMLQCHLCDTFARRNTNRSQAQELAEWAAIIERAVARGASEGGIGLGAAWGSNFEGPFSEAQRMAMLARAHDGWSRAGVRVTHLSLADPMSWNMPHLVERQLQVVLDRWPEITHFHLHLHNGRGMALASSYAALRTLDSRHELYLDATAGGIGGCPYCGNGRATGMAATEDLVAMLEEMGIRTGVNLPRLIETVWLLEEAIGRSSFGHVSKAGPLPRGEALYDPDMPFVETLEEARHFLKGPGVYARQIRPWRTPVSEARNTEARDEDAR